MEFFEKLLDFFFPNRYKKYQIQITNNKENIIEAYNELTELSNKNEYLTKKSYDLWSVKWDKLSNLIISYPKIRNKIYCSLDKELYFLFSALQRTEFLENRNNQFIKNEMEKNREFFNSLENYPLTEKQCKAIIVDEWRNLIIAGAGTGKTSTLIGKAGYLIRKGSAQPDEVLLLSFGRDPRDEMIERAHTRLGLPLNVSTFHGLGMSLIADAQNEKPMVSKLSSDQAALIKYIENIFDDSQEDEIFLRTVNQFFLRLTNVKTQWDFKTQNDYFQYIKSQHLRSLNGEYVKSHQELEIANFLYLNSVEYEYEKPYEYRTESKLHRQYLPDFYLPKFRIYLEHFGVDEHGNTAPYIPKERYHEEIQWKRNLHEQFGTTLIETYSYEAQEEGILEELGKKLRKKGVELNPLPEEKIFEKLNEMGLVSQLSRLLATFLNLYKSNNMTREELKQRITRFEYPKRANAFYVIFSKVLDEYEKHLASQNEIDFNDMINRATEYIAAGRIKPSYKYILVDEFQDISQSRYKLLKAMLDNNPESKLFAVGDDWQSIFRFAGSDLTILTQFEKYFGESKVQFVDENFRFNNKICDFSTNFILANPNQIHKQLKSHDVATKPAVSLIYTKNVTVEIEKILTQLVEEGGSVQILGRYNYQKPSFNSYPKLKIEYYTIHRSKGTQADFIIILGLSSGVMGFPCEIADDPLLQLVSPEPEMYPHAEERRLFYVALTRARKHVYLLVDRDKPSVFIKEILEKGFEVEIKLDPAEKTGDCPRCGGSVVKRAHDGYFYSCDNFPYCEYKAPKCPGCGGSLLLNNGLYQCEKCAISFKLCPSCKEGFLIKRVGPFPPFMGCSHFPECTYKEKT